jgi:hypothetical protein
MSNRLEIIIDDQIVDISVYRFSDCSHLLSIKYDDIYLIEKLEILRVHSYIRYNKQYHVYNILDNLFNDKNKYTFLQFKNRRLYLTENDELERLIKDKIEKKNNSHLFFFMMILLIVLYLSCFIFEKEIVTFIKTYYDMSVYEPILFHT